MESDDDDRWPNDAEGAIERVIERLKHENEWSDDDANENADENPGGARGNGPVGNTLHDAREIDVDGAAERVIQWLNAYETARFEHPDDTLSFLNGMLPKIIERRLNPHASTTRNKMSERTQQTSTGEKSEIYRATIEILDIVLKKKEIIREDLRDVAVKALENHKRYVSFLNRQTGYSVDSNRLYNGWVNDGAEKGKVVDKSDEFQGDEPVEPYNDPQGDEPVNLSDVPQGDEPAGPGSAFVNNPKLSVIDRLLDMLIKQM
jgi:hypothetical protein